MPIYEFLCPLCKSEIEVIASVNEEITCVCGGGMMRKISVPMRIIIKDNTLTKARDYIGSDESRYLTPGMKEQILKDAEKQ